jgi:hypothetical protein
VTEELQAGYLGDTSYAPNTSFGWYATGPVGTANQDWVADAFTYVVGRSPDAGAWTYWIGRLQGGASRSSVASALASSTETRRRLVVEDYRRILGRTPSAATVDARLAQLHDGRTITSIRTELAGGAEYFTKAGATDAKVVTALWTTYLGHPADQAAQQRWVPRLRSHQYTRAQLAGMLQDSEEGRRFQVARFLARDAGVTGQTVNEIAAVLYHPRSEQASIVAVTVHPDFEG